MTCRSSPAIPRPAIWASPSPARFFAVGAVVPHIRGGRRRDRHTAFVNPLNGVDGLAMLADGKAPEEIVAVLAERDAGRDQRQFHLIDAAGRNAAYTGSRCIDWAGHLVGENVSVAGNMLAGPQVVAATLDNLQPPSDRRSPNACLRRCRPARTPAATSAEGSPPRCVVYRDQDYPG